MVDRFACPKCQRMLQSSGVVSLCGSESSLPVFQCDDCIAVVTAMGIEAEVAFTFVVRNGQAFDPAAPDDPLLPSAN